MQNDPKGGERRAKNKGFLCISFKIDPPPFFLNKKTIFLKKLYSLLVDLQGRGIRLLVVLEGKGIGLLVVQTGRE